MLLRRWEETRTAVEQGWYPHEGRRVPLAALLEPMLAGTRLYPPEELRRLTVPAGDHRTAVAVTDESTLAAARRLAAAGASDAGGAWGIGDGGGAGRRVGALNFASARKPGGGVQTGSRAQEEDLARSSALWPALRRCPEFYAFHNERRDALYSDRVIYAPGVPVFRDDDGRWLPEPVPVDFLTAAAPNRRVLERERPEAVERLPEVFAVRAHGVLAVAAEHGVTDLVLGAWGCGVFGNDPATVAGAFRTLLHGEFAGVFPRVVFAVLDRTGATRRVFADTLG